MLRIGINALYLLPGVVGGTEVYLRELLLALAELDRGNEYFVFTNRETGAGLVPPRSNFHHQPQKLAAAFRPARILWEQTWLPVAAARLKLDVMLNPGFTAPLISICPNVTVFHDLQHKRYPQYSRGIDLLFLRLLLWAAAHRSRGIIAVSEATRTDLLHFYRIPEAKIKVIPHGVHARFFHLDRSRIEPYLLCVSAIRPNKNLERLIAAFAKAGLDRRLIIAGPEGPLSGTLRALAADVGVGDRVMLTGWISDDQLLDLYEKSHAVVYPSLFEGFGMPVLEALAAGIPVACSAIAPLREIAEGAALLFDPLDESAMAEALQRICGEESLRQQLRQAGPERARRYTWKASAEATLAALHAAQAWRGGAR